MAGRHRIEDEDYETHDGGLLAFSAITQDEDYDDLLKLTITGEDGDISVTMTSEDVASVCEIMHSFVNTNE